MLSNAYFLAKFRFDTAENEPAKNLQKFGNFPNFANPNQLRGVSSPSYVVYVFYLTHEGGPHPRDRAPVPAAGAQLAVPPGHGGRTVLDQPLPRGPNAVLFSMPPGTAI